MSKKISISFTPRQVDILQDVLAEDYVRGRIENETEPTVEPAWLRSLIRIGDSIEKQTGVKSEVRQEMEAWTE